MLVGQEIGKENSRRNIASSSRKKVRTTMKRTKRPKRNTRRTMRQDIDVRDAKRTQEMQYPRGVRVKGAWTKYIRRSRRSKQLR